MGFRRFREAMPGVLLATADIYMTNSTAVVHEDRVLLIDPALLPSELAQIADELEERGLTVETGYATHAHWDHVLWPPSLRDVPRYAARQTLATIERYPAMTRGSVEEAALRWNTRWDMTQVANLLPLEGDILAWSGPPARVIVHDAHVPGHTALHFPDLGLLVAGDMVSDIEPPGLDEGLPGDQRQIYLEGLAQLEQVPSISLFIPGHGRPGDDREFRRRLAADRRSLETT